MSSFIQSPVGRAGHALLHNRFDVSGEQLILVGGYNECGPLAEIWVYDIERSLWSEVMGGISNKGPLPRVDFSACLLGTKIYLFGGMEQDNNQALIYNDLWSFDLISRQWLMLEEETCISERMGHIGISIGADSSKHDHMIIHGGDCLGNVFNDTWLYCASTASWQCINTNSNQYNHTIATTENSHKIPGGRSSHTACFVTNNSLQGLIIFGGSIPTINSDYKGSNDSTPTDDDNELTHMNDMWILDMTSGIDNASDWSWLEITPAKSSSSRPGKELATLSTTTESSIKMETDEEALDSNSESDDDDEDSALFPSPRDLPSVISFKSNNNESSKLLICGGFGYKEISSDTIDNNDIKSGEISKISSTSIEEEVSDDDVIEIGYLNDIWIIGLDGVGTEIDHNIAQFHNVSTSTGISADTTTSMSSWGGGGSKRGCKMVSTCKGVFSFGGFDGNSFCAELECMNLMIQ